MKPTKVDLHIHTKYCPCAKEEMIVKSIVNKALERGLKVIGVTPHSYPIVEQGLKRLKTYEKVREEIKAFSNSNLQIFLGAEVDCINSSGTLVAGKEIAKRVDYILAAPGHYHLSFVNKPPQNKKEKFYYHHRTISNLLDNPLVSAIAHPYSSVLEEMNILGKSAQKCFEEIALKAKKKKKAIEINNKFFISNSYPIEFIESYKFFIKVLAEKRVMFLLGSDAHSLDNVGKVPGNIFEELDISESQIWLPQSRNFA